MNSRCKFDSTQFCNTSHLLRSHQWLFITDTVDIIYPPDDWISDSLLDRLASAIGERQMERHVSVSKSCEGLVIHSRHERMIVPDYRDLHQQFRQI